MIKAEKIHVVGFEEALRGMRNAYASWDNSDSGYDPNGNFFIGERDKTLALKLAKSGTDHGKYLRFIVCYMDLTAPIYWWAEMDTYKVGTVRDSCSFMHTGMSKPFDINDFSLKKEDTYWESVIEWLNTNRELYLKTRDEKVFQQIRCIMPQGYLQKATMMYSYAALRNMYHARKDHRLDEWREFCKVIEELPYSELITTK